MAIAPVIIDFEIKNIERVQNAFRSVADAVAGHENTANRAVAQGTQARERAYAKLARDAERWQAETVRGAEKAAKGETQAAERASKDKARAAADAARKQEREFANVAKQAAKWTQEEVRAAERAAKSEVAAAEKAAAAEAKAAEGAAKAKIRAYQSADREAARASARALADHERDEKKKNASAAKWVRGEEKQGDQRREKYSQAIMGGASKAAGHLVRGGTALASTALQLGGGFNVQDTLKERLELERSAIQFSNSAFQNMPGEKRMGSKELQQHSKDVAIKTGTDASELLAGSASYGAKSGKYQEGIDLQEFFGKVAKGTGATVADVAATAGTLRVQNKDLTTEGMKSLILNTVRSGQRGSVEFSDLAKVAGKVTRSSSSYAGDQEKTQGKLLGLAQIAMRTSGSPEEAATVLSNLSADAMKHSDKVTASLGKGTFDDKGRIQKAPEEFLADVMSKTGGNLQKIQGMGFGQRSMKMFQALAPTYNTAEKAALEAHPKDKAAAAKAGREAVLSDMKEMTDASMNMDELEKNVGEIMKSSAEQFEAAVRQLKTEVADNLVPALTPLIQILKDATPSIGRFLSAMVELAGWASRNPLAAAIIGLGASITREVMGQIISAKIGEVIKSLLGGGGGVPVPGGAPLGTLGKGLAVAGAGLAAVVGTKEWVDEGFHVEAKKLDDRVGAQAEATNLATDATHGPLTEDQRKRAIELTKQLKGDLAAQNDEMDPEKASTVKKVTGAFGAVVGGKDFEEAQKTEQAEQARTYAETKLSLEKLVAALEKNTAATAAGSKTPAPDGADGPSKADPNDPSKFGPVVNRPGK